MIEAFETDKDMHRLTASMIFEKSYDEVTSEDGTCSIGDGTHSERY
jgi:DNA polymerase I-like protein with 3'-5' exonuclease and polymerase domains